jgi:hypothetical protein
VATVLLKDMVPRSRRLQRNATSASLILNRLAPCAAVLVVPPGLHRAAVTADTGSASAAYDVDAAFMHISRHDRGIHAL